MIFPIMAPPNHQGVGYSFIKFDSALSGSFKVNQNFSGPVVIEKIFK
jgi:hypothetical protein